MAVVSTGFGVNEVEQPNKREENWPGYLGIIFRELIRIVAVVPHFMSQA